MSYFIVSYFLYLQRAVFCARYSALGRGAGAGLVHAIVAVSKLILVFRLHVIDTTATVKLTAEHLICLDETLELASEVGILALKAASMLLESLALSKKITVVSSVLTLSDAEALNVTPRAEQTVFLFLETELRVADLHRHISVAALLELNFLAKIIVLSTYTLIIPTKSTVLGADASILFTNASELTLGIFKGNLLVSEVSTAAVEKLLRILNASLGTGQLEVEGLEFISLVGSLSGSLLIHFLQTGKLTPHLSTLHLDAFNLALKVLKLGPLIIVLIALGNGFFAQTASLEVLFIEHTFGASELVVKVKILLSPKKKRKGHSTELWSLSIIRNSKISFDNSLAFKYIQLFHYEYPSLAVRNISVT